MSTTVLYTLLMSLIKCVVVRGCVPQAIVNARDVIHICIAHSSQLSSRKAAPYFPRPAPSSASAWATRCALSQLAPPHQPNGYTHRHAQEQRRTPTACPLTSDQVLQQYFPSFSAWCKLFANAIASKQSFSHRSPIGRYFFTRSYPPSYLTSEQSCNSPADRHTRPHTLHNERPHSLFGYSLPVLLKREPAENPTSGHSHIRSTHGTLRWNLTCLLVPLTASCMAKRFAFAPDAPPSHVWCRHAAHQRAEMRLTALNVTTPLLSNLNGTRIRHILLKACTATMHRACLAIVFVDTFRIHELCTYILRHIHTPPSCILFHHRGQGTSP